MDVVLQRVINNSLRVLFNFPLNIRTSATNVRATYIPLARIEYSGSPSDLNIRFESEESSPASTNLEMILVPANNNNIYGVYENGSGEIFNETINPPNNAYDVLIFTSVTRSLRFNYSIVGADVGNILNMVSSINVPTTGRFPIETTVSFIEVPTLSTQQIIDSLDSTVYQGLPSSLTTVHQTIGIQDLLEGTEIRSSILGTIGFVFNTESPTGLRIFDITGSDITDTFTKVFNVAEQRELYINNNKTIPTNLYFKFQE